MKKNNATFIRDTYKFNMIKNAKLTGKYDFPIATYTTELDIDSKFIPFNYALTIKKPEDFYVYFYIDDYQFERLWNYPSKYLNLLKKFKGVIAPDFSMYIDMPMAMQIWNIYRTRVLSYFWSINNIKVIPNASWSNASSYRWCFDGLPSNAVIAVSSIGCVKNKKALLNFCEGFLKMEEILKPKQVLFFGNIPDSIQHNKTIKQITEDKKWADAEVVI